ncbi:hypothetical protein L873DRAFT_1807214 [Choiromyces venosus 120613-1]|uniref:Uncharacterized protein n=1 Tax=Choiromyces venosus 120613-1 TaxID=1336337 RepID=A0A3N4JLF1_9PEZI|nr:hypothetical protein L873DRAFT_1807214 [Choiromyces venosus 120613-1]
MPNKSYRNPSIHGTRRTGRRISDSVARYLNSDDDFQPSQSSSDQLTLTNLALHDLNYSDLNLAPTATSKFERQSTAPQASSDRGADYKARSHHSSLYSKRARSHTESPLRHNSHKSDCYPPTGALLNAASRQGGLHSSLGRRKGKSVHTPPTPPKQASHPQLSAARERAAVRGDRQTVGQGGIAWERHRIIQEKWIGRKG